MSPEIVALILAARKVIAEMERIDPNGIKSGKSTPGDWETLKFALEPFAGVTISNPEPLK